MRSSTSSSDPAPGAAGAAGTAGATGPGAGPPPQRPIPALPWGRVLALAVALCLLALGGWEAWWRAQQFRPSYRNSDGLWAMTRARVDREGPGGTVIIGSSRVLFDVHLEAWREATGQLPVQLALEGTNPRPVLTHLARESDFAGLLIVGVTPPLFFTPGFGYRAGALERYRTETPAEWLSQRLSMVVEPWLAFYNFDTALFTVLRRQPWWPVREGVFVEPAVRKLSDMQPTRQAHMWSRVEHDPAYNEIARNTWLAILQAPRETPPPEAAAEMREALFAEVAADVEAIRERGGEVVFVRMPSTGPFREAERGGFPREGAWDELLRRADAAGVHFEDHADLQDVTVPEWSHIRAGDTRRFTRALVVHIREALARRGVSRTELGP